MEVDHDTLKMMLLKIFKYVMEESKMKPLSDRSPSKQDETESEEEKSKQHTADTASSKSPLNLSKE